MLYSFVMSNFTIEQLEAVLVEKLKKAIDPLQKSDTYLCNRLVMYRLQIILFHCKQNGCLVFLAPWLFQTASTTNYY